MGIHDFRFLDKLSKSNNEVYLVTYYPKKELPKEVREIAGLKVIHEYAPLTFSYGADKLIVFTRKIRCWISFIRSFYRLKNIIKSIKPDIVHAGWIQGSGFMAALVNFHPLLLMPMGSDILLTPQKNRRLFNKTKFAIKRADMITCDCEYVKNRIVKDYAYPIEKIVVFPRGVDLSVFHPGYDGGTIRNKLGWGNKKIIIMPRHFRPVYGVEYFIKALPYVVKADSDIRILLCGQGPMENEIRKLVNELGLAEYVHFTGEVKNNELPLYLNASDLYVSASLSDGSSLSLLEAMACALPVVVTDVPSNMEWIKDGNNGYVVPRKNSLLLAEKMISLLKNDELRKAFAERNLEIAQKRADWDKNFKILEGMYDRLNAC
jgi:glycosyltransferase involved in cell wall biosynthesis